MAKEAGRPHFNLSIIQLEALFEQLHGDVKSLKVLQHELSFRTTERAKKLSVNITKTLAASPDVPACVKPVEKKPTAPRVIKETVRSEKRKVEVPFVVKPQQNANTTLPPSHIPTDVCVDSQQSNKNDAPESIIATWIALEALSPQTYRHPADLAGGDYKCVVDLSKDVLPWLKGESSRPNKRLYYQVTLGAINMAQATEDLIKAFGDDDERGNARIREKAAIAVVLVDKNGLLLEENGIAISSFAWALPLALQLKLASLGTWAEIEHKLIEKLDNILRRVDKNGSPLSLDMATIHLGFEWLIKQFGLPERLVEKPNFALRIFQYYKIKSSPEPSLLNSFFLNDLALAAKSIKNKSLPLALQSYLGMRKPDQFVDLFCNTEARENAVCPAMMPSARWPVKGGHPLVLLQQAAVNISRAQLTNDQGIVAVNGPPGTGKTTLLRDIVASIVTDRAVAMSSFDDPEKAFTPSGEKIAMGGKAFFQMYSLAPALKGHEILVASSNNKAVENVSRELPSQEAIGRNDILNYFKTISDLVHSQDSEEEESDIFKTWGMIAAVLGNGKNRFNFQKSFWWDEDCSFRLYLKAAKGDTVTREIRDPETHEIIERLIPKVIINENPPTPQNAKREWEKARRLFLTQKQTIDNELATLEKVRQCCLELAHKKEQIIQLQPVKESLIKQLQLFQQQFTTYQYNLHIEKNAVNATEKKIAEHTKNKPNFLARLFNTLNAKKWRTKNNLLSDDLKPLQDKYKDTEQKTSEINSAINQQKKHIDDVNEQCATLQNAVSQLSLHIESFRPLLGSRIVDEHFLRQSHDDLHKSSPWLSPELQRKRGDLFIAAMNVHKAFIGVAAQKILHNLSILMDVFSGKSLQGDARLRLLGDLWSTLFLVVPVLSTTFASVERMFGQLPATSIGWLLIDEAGQALPQAAVGALMRSQRAIIVGDPLQIPPVVTLPERLNTEICQYFSIEKKRWAAPEASSQTLADQASRFQATFKSDTGLRKVGIPLLVHRRCQQPMFGISNLIAYDNQMVHAPTLRDPGQTGKALGPSRWFDVNGEADSKWCKKEGDFVISLLKKMADNNLRNPDIFIITPFRIIAQELRRSLEKETQIFAKFGVNISEWINDRVGTIHTVQGREAESVILVLGAPMHTQNGARHWASATPNILNVAVSRAKQNIYVVGSRGAWAVSGHARTLASSIPMFKIK